MTVVNGQVTDVTALELPSGGRSGQISREAEPILHDEALSAQSASIDGVSGATYTSLGLRAVAPGRARRRRPARLTARHDDAPTAGRILRQDAARSATDRMLASSP